MRAWKQTLGWRAAFFTVVIAGNAISGTADQTGLVVASSTRCSVGLTKVSYDTPGADDAELIELRVSSVEPALSPATNQCGPSDAALNDAEADAGALTLADCGLSALELVDDGGDQCDVYRTIPLAGTVIPSDGYVVLCAEGSSLALAGSCDVSHAGKAALKDGWLQNGPQDGLRFTGTNGDKVEIGYEGRPACLLPSATELADETGQAANVVGAPEDDINVFCDGAFTLIREDEAPLRAAAQCPRSLGAGGLVDGSTDADDAASEPWTEERAPATGPSGNPPFYEPSDFDAGLVAVTSRAAPRPDVPGCELARGRAPSPAPKFVGLLVFGAVLVRRLSLTRRTRRTLRRPGGCSRPERSDRSGSSRSRSPSR